MDSRFECAARRARESARELSLAFERTAEALGPSARLAVAHAERHGAGDVDLVLKERRAADRARKAATSVRLNAADYGARAHGRE